MKDRISWTHQLDVREEYMLDQRDGKGFNLLLLAGRQNLAML